MKRALALAMIALLAVPATAAVGAPDTVRSETPAEDTVGTPTAVAATGTGTNHTSVNRTRLELPDDPRHGGHGLSLDIGTVIALDDGVLESRYQLAVDRRRIAGEGIADPLVVRFTDRIESRIDELRTREETAARAYAENEISNREFARRLALISAEAARLENQLGSLKATVDRRETALRIDSLILRLQTFRGPAHGALERSLRGERSSDVSVAATPQGYVLGLLNRSEGTYYRHAVRFDNRNLAGNVTLGTPIEGINRVRTLYSETNTDEVFITSARYANDGRLIQLNVNYPAGPVTMYVDTATADVFYEERRLEFERMPRSTVLNETIDGVRLVVERTHDNGPTLVRATDADTGEPVGVTLAVDGRDVGGTGINGERWFIGAPGAYNLSVSQGDAVFNVTVPAP